MHIFAGLTFCTIEHRHLIPYTVIDALNFIVSIFLVTKIEYWFCFPSGDEISESSKLAHIIHISKLHNILYSGVELSKQIDSSW